jgi:hypothetical protein
VAHSYWKKNNPEVNLMYITVYPYFTSKSTLYGPVIFYTFYFKGTLTQKVFKINILADSSLRPAIWAATIFNKNSESPFKSYAFLNVRSIEVKICLPVAPDCKLIRYLVRVSTFFYWYPVCPRPILMVCGLPPRYYNLTSGCRGDSKSANVSPPGGRGR